MTGKPRPALRSLVLLATLSLLLHAVPADAHNRSVSYSNWQANAAVLAAGLRLPSSELNRLGLDPFDARTPAEADWRWPDGSPASCWQPWSSRPCY